jgi:CheY-like chemotaxis protein
LETAGTIARGTAHDFGNLLTAIQGNLLLAMTTMRPPDTGFQYLSRLSQAVNRALDLVSKLRAISQSPPTEKKAIDARDELKTGIDLLHVLEPGSIEIETHISEEPCPIEADPSLLQDMIQILCQNARDAMAKGGRLVAGLERVLLDAGHPDLDPDLHPGEYACISVRDTGQGMSWELRSKVFEPFFTTKDPEKNAGLGLPMVQRIVKDHGGFINFESEEGEGTTFWVYLPIMQTESEKAKFNEIGRHQTGKGECILAADDDAFVLDVIEEILQDSGYKVITALNGQDAIEKFRQEQEHIDLVLLDVVMPEVSGRGVFNQIRELRPDMRVLFASGNQVDIPEAVEAPRASFIQKPYSLSELLRGIRQMLDRS